MEYKLLKPKRVIQVRGLYSLHYFQFASGYVFNGERHDFWEMVYMDQGEADIGADKRVLRLGKGQAIFHQPGEYHSIWANYAQGVNLFVISFECKSPAMRAFRKKICTLGHEQRRLLSQMISEGQRAFGPVLDISDQKQLIPLPDCPAESVQKIVLSLEHLLLGLLHASASQPAVAGPRLPDEAEFALCFEEAQRLMRERLDGSLRFPELCRALGVSGTVLKERFKRYANVTVMETYQRIRIEEARRLLRAGEKRTAQIADELGYSSPAAFSRQFKRLMGIAPREYVSSVFK